MAKQTIQRVEKPWGYELIWAKTGDYVGKILHIKKGHKLSLQYHRQKEETILVSSGEMLFVFEDEKRPVEALVGEPPHHLGCVGGDVQRHHGLVACAAQGLLQALIGSDEGQASHRRRNRGLGGLG